MEPEGQIAGGFHHRPGRHFDFPDEYGGGQPDRPSDQQAGESGGWN